MALYAELHCKTNFSFLRGASHADELVARAHELGYGALAVTDRQSLAGVVRGHIAAKEIGLKLVIGAEMLPLDAASVVLWATNRKSYARLSRLITVGRRRTEKGECAVCFEDLAEFHEGLIAGVLPDDPREIADQTGDLNGDSPAWTASLARDRVFDLDAQLSRYRELFGDRCYLLAELHRGPDDESRLGSLAERAGSCRVPLVAASDVHYHLPGRMPLHDVMTAIRRGTTVSETSDRFFPNAQRHLRTLEELAGAYSVRPDALQRTGEIADRCTFSLDELRYEYPEELAPPGLTPLAYLEQLTWQGAAERYPDGIPDKIRRLVEYELSLIKNLQYEAYFLTVWDLVRFARERNILCQGRGSAANSVVCFCLGVTSVDPDRTDVLFERFVSRERNEPPDIDVDFEHERREEVLQYLYDKYGRERAGMTAVVTTYRSRSAVRDVGKALGLSLDRVDALAKSVEGYSHEPKLDDRCRQVGLDPESELGRRFLHLVNELIGFPRHLSQHVGGMVMTRGPLCELAPIENAAMEGRTVIQWDKDDLDELGILKVDVLALGMLTAIRKCFDLLEKHEDRKVTLATIPEGDQSVYDMICRADTMGVFQIESRAQMSMLPRLKPRCYYDLVIEVAIVRPGPIQGQMVHPYLRRRANREVVTYPNDAIREVLEKTMGVPIFQEQAMRLSVVAAGFTPGEADQLRRAMAAWRRPGLIDQFHKKLIDGMLSRGLTREFADQVFTQIRGFGEYGFPESHAASFALLVYASSWLKHHYPAIFAAAIINSQPMGFYAPAQLIRDARQHGVEVRPIDVNRSHWDCTLEDRGAENVTSTSKQGKQAKQGTDRFAVRLGFRLLNGIHRRDADQLVAARAEGPFESIPQLSQRTKLSRAVLELLAEADAYGSLGIDRRRALWDALGQDKHDGDRPLLADLEVEGEPLVELPPLALSDQVLADYRAFGMSLKAHPISFHRESLSELRVLSAADLESAQDGDYVRIGGLVLLRQRPSTARGITFVTLEDETGIANLVLRQEIWERFYEIARCSPAWIAHGKLEKKESVIHVVVQQLEDLSARLGDLQVKSRDFR
jgi:error-prone DNA polymerase